jgi:hypothetical protein
MVVPRMGASWALKKFADEVMASPQSQETAPDTESTPTATAAKPETDELDGQLVSDQHGEVIGTARRLRGIAVYLVSDSYGNLEQELEHCVLDDESRRYFARDDKGRLTGIIYAPHPDRMPKRAEAFRAEDI